MPRNRQKKKKFPLKLVVLFALIIVIIVIIVLVVKNNKNKLSYDGNSLIGTFVYENNNTKYVFNDNGTGNMSSNSFKYDYKYKVEGNLLSIDFSKQEVHDVKYSFELSDGVLKLTSKEGTVSVNEVYILKKENK